MLKNFINDNSYIKSKKTKKYFLLNKTLTPIKLIGKKSNNNIFYKKTNTTYNLKKIIHRNENRNSNDLNRLNTDYNNISTNGNNNSYSNCVKTTMDTNMTRTKITKETKENLSFINDNTFIHFTPSTNYQSSNVKNRNKRKKIKIPKQDEKYLLSKDKSKNVNKTFIIPNRLNSLINVEENIIKPIKRKSKIFYKKSVSLNKNVNTIKDKINLINKKRKSIDEKSLLIKKSKLKNICFLFEQKIESISNKDILRVGLKKDIEKLDNKIKTLKKETNQMNINKDRIKEEIMKDKNQILTIKQNIENIKNDKKKVNAMLVLLHKRIIDIKNRIKKHDELNLYLDKSFHELNQKFQNLV